MRIASCFVDRFQVKKDTLSTCSTLMPVTIALLPLPGKSQILEGKYGLEMSVVRGIIRIHYRNELQILDLSMFVAGSLPSSSLCICI
jgi:hypothetical protein